MNLFIKTLLNFAFLFISSFIIAQDSLQKVYDLIDEEKYFEAINVCQKQGSENINAQIAYCLLLTKVGESEKASKEFKSYFKKNPQKFYPYIYSFFYDNFITGPRSKKPDYNSEFLDLLSKQDDTHGKLAANVRYWQSMQSYANADFKASNDYMDQINYFNKWSFVGPFDNVMNSGFNKEYETLDYPKSDHTFIGNYGQEISWFTPPMDYNEGYIPLQAHFKGNSITGFAQTFVKSENEHEVIIDFAYTGSAKLWINDQLIYSESAIRVAGYNSFFIKTKLNSGYNRILVQLGNYNVNSSNFTVRVLNTYFEELNFNHTAENQTYVKSEHPYEMVENFAVDFFKSKVDNNTNELFDYINLVNSYMRAHRADEAEDVLKRAEQKFSDNYFLILEFIEFYSDVSNENELNKYIDKYKRLYPDDHDVLVEVIREESTSDNILKCKELISTFQKKYPKDKFNNEVYDLSIAGFEEDYVKALGILDNLYEKYPNEKSIVEMKYNTEKSMSNSGKEANYILENYLKDNFDYGIIYRLGNEYVDAGNIKKAIKLFESKRNTMDSSYGFIKKLIELYQKKEMFDEALELCQYIADRKPSDYDNYAVMADIYKFKDEKEKVEEYNKKTIYYFPFDFSYNEKIRKSSGKEEMSGKFPNVDPLELIEEFEKNSTEEKNSISLVSDNSTVVLYNTTSMARAAYYIVKLHDEEALSSYQQLRFESSGSMRMNVKKVQTIKPNGTRIDAERRGYDFVLTNLEVGDYVFVSYVEKQYDGGKTSKFFYDYYDMNGFYPLYKKSVDVYIQDGLYLKYEFVNSDIEPKVEKEDDFTHYTWEINDQKAIKQESYMLPFSDIGKVLYLTLDYEWDDIIDWYQDLSDVQATPDFTIKKLAQDLFEDRSYTDKEKAQVIYDFIVKNIQYSSIDFRQGSYVPQKSSDVFHTRLGDCKDVSTLFTSIAQEVDLDAHLVLIKTRDYGQNSVVVPSLNFNHCIVKLNLEDEVKYLELTDPYLPFGYLNSNHEGASILEIEGKNTSSLKFLSHKNEGISKVKKTTEVTIKNDRKISLKTTDKLQGLCAALYTQNYLNETEEKREEYWKSNLASFFKTAININNLSFEKMEKGSTEINVKYDAEVEKEILKIGSLNTFRIPFTDLLADNTTFQDTSRTFDMSYFIYEPYDEYYEKLTISLPEGSSFTELPENMHFEYEESSYDLKINQISSNKIAIERIFKADRKVITKVEYKDFRKYILDVIEAENTHLVYK